MTNKEKLKLVEDKIKELVPEIMKVGFGCKVSAKRFDGWQDLTVICLMGKSPGNYFFSAIDKNGNIDEEVDSSLLPDFKILGRDITLEDVLMAIRKSEFINEDESVPYIIKILSKWSLNYRLHKQSESLVNFLYQVFYDQRNK